MLFQPRNPGHLGRIILLYYLFGLNYVMLTNLFNGIIIKEISMSIQRILDIIIYYMFLYGPSIRKKNSHQLI